MRKWLWMQVMEYALSTLKWNFKGYLYSEANYDEWRDTGWEEMQGKIFRYALDHWETYEFKGKCSGHDRYSVGHNLYLDRTKVTGKYEFYEVVIEWPEVKRFIKKMLSPDIEGRQMTLFELLMEEAR